MARLSENWELKLSSKALKYLDDIPKDDPGRILDSINTLSSDPYHGDIKKMAGLENVWRRRVGNYRLFYNILIKDWVVLVFRIDRRTSKTY